ncbi:MAG: ABC transporter transmembrane domain-containing protein, partial [Patescibacteria group bacterium]
MNYKKTLLWYWRISSDKRLMLGGIVLFQIGYILGTVLTPVLEAHVLQRLVDGELTAEYLTWFAVVYVVIRVVLSELFLRAALHLHQVEFTQNLQRVRLYAYNHIINRNVSFQNNNFSGALLNKINTFASSSAVIKGQLMFNFLPTSISLLVACAYALIALPLVGAVTVITSTATVIYAYHATKQRSKLNRIFAKHRSSAVGLMADGLTNIHAVKAEANEHVEAAMTSKKLQETRNAQLKSNIYKNFRIDIVTSLSAKVVQTTALIAAAH